MSINYTFLIRASWRLPVTEWESWPHTNNSQEHFCIDYLFLHSTKIIKFFRVQMSISHTSPRQLVWQTQGLWVTWMHDIGSQKYSYRTQFSQETPLSAVLLYFLILHHLYSHLYFYLVCCLSSAPFLWTHPPIVLEVKGHPQFSANKFSL